MTLPSQSARHPQSIIQHDGMYLQCAGGLSAFAISVFEPTTMSQPKHPNATPALTTVIHVGRGFDDILSLQWTSNNELVLRPLDALVQTKSVKISLDYGPWLTQVRQFNVGSLATELEALTHRHISRSSRRSARMAPPNAKYGFVQSQATKAALRAKSHSEPCV